MEESGDLPILALDFDLNVSRRHAQIWSEHDIWFIEDLGSKHGTFVDREDIRGQGAKVLRPGAIVLTGKTHWTYIPKNWLHIYADNVLIYGSFINSISYALYHCRIPLLGPLFAKNIGENKSASRSLKLEIGDGVFKQSDPYTLEIPALNPGQYVELDTRGIVLRKGVLSPKSEPTYTSVMLRTTDNIRGIVEKTLPVTVLGYWSWSYDKAALRTLAAFISPENSIVRRIVSEAQRAIKGEDGVRSFQDLIIRRSYDKPEQMIMEAIYTYFKDHCAIQWHPPKSEGFYQKIKPPHHIFSSILPRLNGEGTCIDLALLLAGCLENAKLYPIILLTGDEHKQPNHALTGCWIGGWGGRSVIEDKELLQQEVKAGNILAVETTGFATGTPSNSIKLPFQQAMISAKEHIKRVSWVYALDIGSLRPQVYTGLDGDTSLNPGITPLETAAESSVYRAQELAEEFTRVKKRKA
ncbi:MAG: FHA domain-containing protein, partial [Desulfatiglandales bacterium]